MNLLSSRSKGSGIFAGLGKMNINPSLFLGIIILTALLAFEMFNYSTTDYALRDLLGDLKFAGIHWATILTVAFCGIDFAGIARLFTPEQGENEPKEVWYLFGAWLLAATMNAVLTWWGVSMAIVNHNVQSTAVVSSEMLTKVVPLFVALMVWVIRILIIGSLSVAGDRLVWGQQRVRPSMNRAQYPTAGVNRNVPRPAGVSASPARPVVAPRPVNRPEPSFNTNSARPEPTYHSVSMGARQVGGRDNTTRHM